MANRISQFRLMRGLTQKDLAELMGVHEVTVSRWETGDIVLSRKRLDEIAAQLATTAATLIGETPAAEATLVRGAVQAGRWIEANEWDESEWYSVFVPVPARWLDLPKFGLEVRGTSMNRRYVEGSVVICVRLIDADLEPVPGHRYIVQRVDAGGLHEVTVKELRLDRQGRPWLWPDSDDPEHQEPIAFDGEAGEAIEILAIVVASVQPE